MKLHILGASGTGVTTLGQALSACLKIPYLDSDDYFWQPGYPLFTHRTGPELRKSKIKMDVSRLDDWILGGL